ncbi:MAG: sensor domain-containing diguanylate cyclase [Actinomycetota bacterium]
MTVRGGRIVTISPAMSEELRADPERMVGRSLSELGTSLDDLPLATLLDTGREPVPAADAADGPSEGTRRIRLSATFDEEPVRLRVLHIEGDTSWISFESLADEFRLEALLRRGDGHILVSPSMEIDFAMTSEALSAMFPGDDPSNWIELMDPDDMADFATAIRDIATDPSLTRTVRHRLQADRTHAVINQLESAVHDPDLRGILITSRPEELANHESLTRRDAGFSGVAVSDHMPIGVVMAATSGLILHRNAVAAELIGARAGAMLLPPSADTADDAREMVRFERGYQDIVTAVLAGAAAGTSGFCTVPSPCMPDRWLRIAASPAAASTIVIVIEDATELVQAQTEVERSNRLLEALDAHSEELVMVLDHDENPRYVSSAILRYVEEDEPALDTSSVLELVHPDDRDALRAMSDRVRSTVGHSETIDFRIGLPETDDSARWHHGRVTNLLDDSAIEGIVWTVSDIHERRLTQLELEHRASHDDLTGLHGRATIEAELRDSIEKDGRTESTTAVIFCDVDHFKEINDSHGHEAGDVVLRAVAHRLRSAIRSDIDVVGRFGGDEFVVVAPRLDSARDASTLARRILDTVAEPVHIGGRTVDIGISVGVAASSAGAVDDIELLRRADRAMYRSKRGGRGRISIYTEEQS